MVQHPYKLDIFFSLLSADIISSKGIIDRAEGTVKKYDAVVFAPKQRLENTQFRLDVDSTFETADRATADHIRSVFERIAKDYNAEKMEAKVTVGESYSRTFPYKVNIKTGKRNVAAIGPLPSEDLTKLQIGAPQSQGLVVTNSSVSITFGSTQETQLLEHSNKVLVGDFNLECTIDVSGGGQGNLTLTSADTQSSINILATHDGTTSKRAATITNKNSVTYGGPARTAAGRVFITRIGTILSLKWEENGVYKSVNSNTVFSQDDMHLTFKLEGTDGSATVQDLTIGGF